MGTRNKRRARTVVLAALCAYLCLAAGFTAYSQTGYFARLPAAQLSRPSEREIPYVLRARAAVEDGRLVCRMPFGSGVPGDVVLPGQRAAVTGSRGQTGTALVQGQEGTVYGRGGVIFFLEITQGEFREGETADVEVRGRTKSYPGAVPRSAVRYNERQEAYLYTVEAQQGPWGVRFVLKQLTVGTVWPAQSDSEYVLPSAGLGANPIVTRLEGEEAYPGMEVRLMDEGGNES